ncbi:MAG: YaaL family protein [Clostridia bacterium]|nr:YaaL family protein [Clostridia bacterium]
MNVNLMADSTNAKSAKVLKKERLKLEKDAKDLMDAIIEAKQELDSVSKNINFVSDSMLVDHFTFRLKAAEVRYRYLVAQAKQMGIENRMYIQKMYNERYWK